MDDRREGRAASLTLYQDVGETIFQVLSGKILRCLNYHVDEVQGGVHHLRGEVELRAQVDLCALQPTVQPEVARPPRAPESAPASKGLDVESLSPGGSSSVLLLSLDVEA